VQVDPAPVVQKPPAPVQELLYYGLAPAAEITAESASVELSVEQALHLAVETVHFSPQTSGLLVRVGIK
jgi:hypothetical protein